MTPTQLPMEIIHAIEEWALSIYPEEWVVGAVISVVLARDNKESHTLTGVAIAEGAERPDGSSPLPSLLAQAARAATSLGEAVSVPTKEDAQPS